MVAELLVVLRVPLRREVEDKALYTKCSGLKWKRSATSTIWNHSGMYYSNVFNQYAPNLGSEAY